MDEPLAIFILLAPCLLLGGCDACSKKSRGDDSERERSSELRQECSLPEHCKTKTPCVLAQCVDGRCLEAYAPAGTRCGAGSACEASQQCDGKGQCRLGPAPLVDDGNPCTSDACDPQRGVTHTPLPIDDGDPCTRDSCDAESGAISHDTLDVDDGDDCTLDSCDPASGVKHERQEPFRTCETSCKLGFHPSSRTPAASCGSDQALSTFCAPDCGDNFHICDTRCPAGYHSSSRSLDPSCGPPASPRQICQKNAGASFYTCDAACPDGYRKSSETRSASCGRETPAMLFCVQS